MKTKLQLLVSIASLLAFTEASNAKVMSLNDSHINAILNTPSTLKVTNDLNVADISRKSAILNTDNSASTFAPDKSQADLSDLSVNSYHHGGSSSSGSGERHYYINIGAGFALGISDGVFNPEIDQQYGASSPGTFTYSPAVGFYFSSERAFGDHIAIGAMFNYQTCTATYKYTASVYEQVGTDMYGNPIYGYANVTNTDNLSFGAFAFALKITYNITMSDEKLDPYVSLFLGYTFGGFTDNTSSVNSGAGLGLIAGGVVGLAGGFRYWFIENVGVFGEIGFTSGGGFMLINAGLAIKF